MGIAQNSEYPFVELQIANYEDELSNKNGAFIENLGQLGVFGQPDVVASSVEYYSAQPDFFDFVLRDRLSFVSAHSADSVGVLYNVNRLDLLFYDDPGQEYKILNATPYNQGHAKRHFYTGLTSTGIENVREFNEIYFEDLYNDIDLTLSHNRVGLRALFRLQPGVDTATIKIQFDSVTSLNFSGGNVNIGSYQSNYEFHKPVVYQIDNLNNVSFLTSSYAIDGNGRIFFAVPYYDPSYNVYISVKQGDDPIASKDIGDNLERSSYLGEAGATTLYSVTTDDLGNVFYAGKVNNANFAANIGFMPNVAYTDGGDGFLVKFNEDIEPQWYTFIGGDNSTASNLPALDRDTSIAPYTNNGIVMTGTSSSTDLPMVGSSCDIDNNGNSDPDCYDCFDIFYARFNSTGILQYSTYFGDIDYEVPMEIYNKSGNVYIVGERSASTQLLTQSGATNISIGTGLILKFTSSDVLNWATSFNVDRITCVASNESSDLIIAGYVDDSKSMTCITPSTNSNFNAHNGSQFDGFVAIFDPNDVLTHSTFYGGECEDIITDLATDPLTNTTYGIGATFAYPGNSCTNNGSGDIPILGNGLLRATYGAFDHIYFKFTIPQQNVPLNFVLSGYFSGDSEEFDGFSDFGINWTRPSITILGNNEFAISGMSNSGNVGSGTKIPFPASNPINWYQELTNNTTGSSLGRDAYISVFDNTDVLRYTTFFGRGRYSEGPAETHYTNVNNVNRFYFAGNTQTINTATMPLNERLYVEEYDLTVGSTDYYRQYGPINQSGTNEAAWGAFLTIDGLYDVLATENLIEESNYILFPNPSDDELTIRAKENIIKIEIFSMDGKLVLRQSINSSETNVDISNLKKGGYVVSVLTNTSIGYSKILKR